LKDIDLVAQAAHFAAIARSDHRRKGSRQEPYFNHLSEVAELVAAVTERFQRHELQPDELPPYRI
jgi:(p)ppGpp synthase/HD superfamily hydrolase